MYFDVEAPGNKSTRVRSLVRLLKSPGVMISASGFSNTIFLSSNPNELCNRVKLLIQEERVRKNIDMINQEMAARFVKFSEYKCITSTQHKKFF